MEPILIQAADGACAEIYAYGAHVTSWRTPDGVEQLYTSERSEFRAGKAIRGGVPIIFPQFDALGPLPRHGFARTMEWGFLGTSERFNMIGASFRLAASESTRAIWDFEFEVVYHVWVGGTALMLTLEVVNRDERPMTFTGALHTYLRVDEIANARLLGLKGIAYSDKTQAGAEFVQEVEVLTIDSETDRVYKNAPNIVTLEDGTRTLAVEKANFPDCVMWNPYDRAGALADLAAGCERHFVCVEAAVVSNAVTIEPGAHWHGAQTISQR